MNESASKNDKTQKSRGFFRKVAPSIWSSPGDPSVYGLVDLDVTDIYDKKHILPAFLTALNRVCLKHPELRTMVNWGKVVSRQDYSISVMVNIPSQQKDLSALTFAVDPSLNFNSINQKINIGSDTVRKNKDPHLGPLLKLSKWVPFFLLRTGIKIYSSLIYRFNLNLGFLPHRPFGSVIVSNVGSLGIKRALLPLVPLAKSSLMLSIGETGLEPKVIDNQIRIRNILPIGVTFDHRLFDGSHAANMLKDFELEFKDVIQDLVNLKTM